MRSMTDEGTFGERTPHPTPIRGPPSPARGEGRRISQGLTP
jgi:hypothetical protein